MSKELTTRAHVADDGQLYVTDESGRTVARIPLPSRRSPGARFWSRKYRDLLAARVDPEFLAAMEEVLEAWTDPTTYPVDHTVARERVQMALPRLAAALDKLAALNA